MYLVTEKCVGISTCVSFVENSSVSPTCYKLDWEVTGAKVSECHEEKNVTEGGQEAVLTKNTIPGETNFEFRRDGRP